MTVLMYVTRYKAELETTNVKLDTAETSLLQVNIIISDNIENSGEFYIIYYFYIYN